MTEKVPRGDYDMSRSAYLFRHANLVYDMRIQGTSIAKIAEHVGKLEDRPVSRNIIYAFLKKIEDKKERERMIEICDHFGEVKTDLDVVVEKAKKVVCWSPKGLRLSDAAGDQKPVFADAGLIKNTAGENGIKNNVAAVKSSSAIKPSNPTENRETVNIIGFSSPIDVVMLGDKVAYKPSPELTYSRVNPIDEYEEVPGGTTRSELKTVFAKSDLLNREKRKLFREYKDDSRILIPPPEVIFERLKNAAMADPKFAATARDHLTSDMTEYFYIEEAAQCETTLR